MLAGGRAEDVRVLVGCEFSGIAEAMADQWSTHVLTLPVMEAAE